MLLLIGFSVIFLVWCDLSASLVVKPFVTNNFHVQKQFQTGRVQQVSKGLFRSSATNADLIPKLTNLRQRLNLGFKYMLSIFKNSLDVVNREMVPYVINMFTPTKEYSTKSKMMGAAAAAAVVVTMLTIDPAAGIVAAGAAAYATTRDGKAGDAARAFGGAICAAYDNTTDSKIMHDILDIFPSVMDYSKTIGSVYVATSASETPEDATLATNLQVSTTSVALQKDRGLLLSNIQSSNEPNVISVTKSISKLYSREIAQPNSN